MKVIALIVFGLVLSQGVFVKKVSDPNASVFTELEEIENFDMGKKLLDTISLQMKNQAPLADIAKMLQSLRENLILQQQEADMKHAADEVDCETEIAGYNRRIDFASNEITEAQTEINQLTNQVNQLTAEIENKTAQLNILDEQEQVLRDQRQQAAADFVVRVKQSREVIEALNVIAAKLGSITPETDARAVLLELHKMGNSNPIAALVALAAALPKEKLDNVLNKIQELRTSMEQAIVDDQEAETQAQIDFQNLIVEFADQRKNLISARNEATQKLATSQNALGMQKKRKEDAGRELTAATNGKTQKEAECDSLRTQYNRDSDQRSKEIGIIRQVEEILATKIEGASAYLKDRINK